MDQYRVDKFHMVSLIADCTIFLWLSRIPVLFSIPEFSCNLFVCCFQLIRRFLRQTFEYCKRLDWEESFLKSITDIISDVIFHKDNTLGYVLHFMNIYPEELAKVITFINCTDVIFKCIDI